MNVITIFEIKPMGQKTHQERGWKITPRNIEIRVVRLMIWTKTSPISTNPEAANIPEKNL